MSMLTPPGMRGKKYRITGNRHPRMRPRPRRRRNVLTVLGTATAIGLLSYGTVQLVGVFTADEEAGPGPARAQAGSARPGDADCAPPAGEAAGPALPARLPEPESITVNVYNATTRTGLAQDTADVLAQRGFTIGEVSNAPRALDGNVEEPGLLLGTEQAASGGALAVVGTQLDGAETGDVKAEGQPREVDLVIGDGFTGLLAPREADRQLTALAEPSPSPTPSAGTGREGAARC